MCMLHIFATDYSFRSQINSTEWLFATTQTDNNIHNKIMQNIHQKQTKQYTFLIGLLTLNLFCIYCNWRLLVGLFYLLISAGVAILTIFTSPKSGHRYRWTEISQNDPLTGHNTWCRAVNPSTFAVSISAPCCKSLCTSSLSPAAHAAKNTQPEEKLIFRDFCFGWTGSRFVSDSSHRFNCSALLKRAELVRVSIDMII